MRKKKEKITESVIAGLTRNPLKRAACLQEIPASAGMTRRGIGMTNHQSVIAGLTRNPPQITKQQQNER